MEKTDRNNKWIHDDIHVLTLPYLGSGAADTSQPPRRSLMQKAAANCQSAQPLLKTAAKPLSEGHS